jgi:hypothetical protein
MANVVFVAETGPSKSGDFCELSAGTVVRFAKRLDYPAYKGLCANPNKDVAISATGSM